jgi:hypothetical protein
VTRSSSTLARLVAALWLLLAACADETGSSTATPSPDAGGSEDAATPLAVTILGHTDLPRIPATQGLSATFWDEPTRTLWALQDTTASLTPLVASEDFTTFTPGPPRALTGRPTSAWDGEGLTRLGGAWVAVTSETAALVERFDEAGAYLGAVKMPATYATARQRGANKGLESLTSSPDGAWLFTANEQALLSDGDGPSKTAGSTVRILRRELATGRETQHAYRTEPLGPGTGGDMGVSELAALSATRLLVLERGFQAGYGSTVRLFLVDLEGAADVASLPSLDGATPVLPKRLVVDLGTLPSAGFTHPGTQPNPVLDNDEALALGPTLPDGRRVVFVTSDDNASGSQVARVLVLAVSGL